MLKQINLQTAKKTEHLLVFSATVNFSQSLFRTKLGQNVSNAMSLIFFRRYPATNMKGKVKIGLKMLFRRLLNSRVLPICEDDRSQELVDHTHVMRMLGSEARRLSLMLVILADIVHDWRKCTR